MKAAYDGMKVAYGGMQRIFLVESGKLSEVNDFLEKTNGKVIHIVTAATKDAQKTYVVVEYNSNRKLD